MSPASMQAGKVMCSVMTMSIELDEMFGCLGEMAEDFEQCVQAQLGKIGLEVGVLARLIDPESKIEDLIRAHLGDIRL